MPKTRFKSFFKRRRAHLKLGRRGEKVAAKLLFWLDYEVVLRNVRSEDGEIDIIARKDGKYYFIEVKSRRKSKSFKSARPAEAVTLKKQKRIISTAKYFLKRKNLQAVNYEYSVIEVVFESIWKLSTLRLINSAFSENPATPWDF